MNDGRCPRCDNTGDVHRADGEWMGECNCLQKDRKMTMPAAGYGNLKDNLIAAKSIIADPNDWGKGGDRDGACLLDALRVGIDWDERTPEVVEMRLAMMQALPSMFDATADAFSDPLAQYNDLPATLHEDIMALFDRAIDMAEAAAS